MALRSGLISTVTGNKNSIAVTRLGRTLLASGAAQSKTGVYLSTATPLLSASSSSLSSSSVLLPPPPTSRPPSRTFALLRRASSTTTSACPRIRLARPTSEPTPPTPTRVLHQQRAFSSSSPFHSNSRPIASSSNTKTMVLQGCKLRDAFEKDEGASLGFWQCLPGANVSRILARAEGVDWVLVDCEHGNIDDAAMHDAVPAIAACGPSPIVRIPDMQGWMVKRALDAGAHGILVPLLRTVEEAKNVVAAAKFPPQGRRGLGSPFTMERFKPMPTMTEYLQQANSSLLTMVQIETAEALESVVEIAAVPGIDVLFIGPFDLGNNIGFPILDGVMQPELEQAIDRVFQAAKQAGKKCGVFTTSTEQARMYAEKGYHMISIGLDVSILQAALPGRVDAVRAVGSAPGGSKGFYG